MELLNRHSSRIIKRSADQSGIVLFVTLIVLVLMTLGTIAIVRSMDTSTVISGNFAFKQAVMQVSDRGITDATNNLAVIVAGGGGNISQSNRYFSTRQTTVDALGVPTTIDWTQVACRDDQNQICNAATDTGKYRVQYVVERLCTSAPDVTSITSIKTNCEYEVRQTSPEQVAIRYRIIVRAQGPKNASGIYEAVVSGPATT